MGQRLTTSNKCRNCGNELTLEEMHFYAFEDETATCEECEGKWMEAIEAWKNGDLTEFPHPLSFHTHDDKENK